MRQYNQDEEKIFLAPDDGTGSGGASASATPTPAIQPAANTFVDPTAGLDLDDLDPSVRDIIEKSRAGFASLQKDKEQAETARLKEESQRKSFQSSFDQLQHQVKQLTGEGAITKTDPRAQQLSKFEGILKAKGLPENLIKPQAELMLDLMSEYGQELKREIGTDLRPFANSIVSREAEYSWQTAVASDKTGALQNQDIAQSVWEQVQSMAQNGQQVTPQIVLNLTGMAHFDYLQKGGQSTLPQQQQQQQPQMQQLPSVGRLTYPGAGTSASRPIQRDSNAPKYSLDPDTDAALQTVMSKWAQGHGGVKAPGFREVKKGGR